MTANSYPDERDFQPHVLEPGDQVSQYAPTPGYYDRTPASSCGLNPSPDYHFEHDLEDLCQHEPERPRLLQLSEWHDGKVLSRDTEEDVVLTPSAYWPRTLKGKLERLLEGKISRKGRVRSDDTSIAVSVNDRSQRDLIKRFDHLDIDWTAVEKQLLKWGELFCRGKKLRLSITFKYVKDDSLHKITSGRVEKRGRSSVTKQILNKRDAQLDTEENVSRQEAIWQDVYNLMRCPSSSCHLGPHCWQDPHGKKHYKLGSHQLKRLIAFVEKGGALLSHDNVPDNFREELYMKERHRLETQQSQKSKMVGTPGSCQPININFNGMQSSPQQDTSDPTIASAVVLPPNDQVMEDLDLTGLRDEAFRQACNVALANGLDLRLIYKDQDPSFFIDKGIVVGIARQFVRDIGQWVKCVRNVTLDDQATQAAA
ncbi:unnamed protein product [Penicillium salamii]|uniref:Uncharacterized protein n=1 Tax=Penicillium salamii TaxID=1612424 RepID=A0A9W4IKH1_9EURO|nr:unnamed protein product [Penicillium salamii]